MRYEADKWLRERHIGTVPSFLGRLQCIHHRRSRLVLLLALSLSLTRTPVASLTISQRQTEW